MIHLKRGEEYILSSLSKSTNTLQVHEKGNTTIITKKWTRKRINLEHKPVSDFFLIFFKA